MREEERKEMEKRGLVDKQDAKKNLQDAIVFVGSCMDMCPTFERVRRTYENNFKQLEKDPNTGKVTRELAVKAFSRPAAGQPPPLPSDVRPPAVLKSTLYYLIDNVIPELPASHSFLWDRTRSIRQDFTYQNYSGAEAIECNELIARIHIVSLHEMAGSDQEYSQQQELEQFNKALQTLSEFYSERRQRGLPQAPREAEFRAYQLLSHLRDTDIERQVQELPVELFESKEIQLALKLRALIQQNNHTGRGAVYNENSANYFALFFRAIKTEASYLFSCLLESGFNDIRFHALKAMSRAYHQRGKPYYVSRLVDMLGFDTEEQVLDYCKHYDLPVVETEPGNPCVEITAWNDKEAYAKSPLPQAYSNWVNSKAASRDLKTIIYNGDDYGSLPPQVPAVQKKQPLPKPQLPQPQVQPSKPAFPAVTTTEQKTFSFGSTTQPPQKQPELQPSFTFPKPPPQPQKQQQLAPEPAFSFSTAKSTPSPLSSVSPAPPAPAPAAAAPEKPKAAAEPPAPAPAPAPPSPIRFTAGELKSDAQTVLKKIIGPILREEIVPNKWKEIQQKRQERNQLLDHLGRAILGDLVGSLVKDRTIHTTARELDNRRLKRTAIRALKQSAVIAKERADEKQRRREEYEAVSKLLGRSSSLKRSNSNRSSRRSSLLNQKDQVKMVKQTRKEASLAWEPLELESKILPRVTSAFKKMRSFDRTIRMTVFSQDWDSVSGQWVRSKLGLVWNGQTYENQLKDLKNGTIVDISALENTAEKYSVLTGLLFECGISTDENFDKAALHEVLTFIKGKSRYKVTVVLTYWGNKTEVEFLQQLDIDQESFPDISLRFCSMSQSSSSLQLDRCMQLLADSFIGELSQAGIQEREEIAKEQQLAAQRRLARKEEQERLQKFQQEEERYQKMQSKNSLHLFDTSPPRPSHVPKEIVAGKTPSENSDTPLKRKHDDLSLIPRGIAELKSLVSEVTKRSRNQ
ncbi:hypothetical protein TRICI_001079 [Trichomonascus ciferrii]|uniref:Nuclear mRNA export factor n=1 Tax=Trichomonascus ciferrii TaxID=44093 RepID=A0A642VAC7_9ASCO|nr:hypothetical protein TRICI_001079 [Trichomonascus ciferrii]